jgi:hypothetical protein
MRGAGAGRLVANEVAEDQDRAFIRGEPPEATVELVSMRDAQELIRCGRAVSVDRAPPALEIPGHRWAGASAHGQIEMRL